MSGEAIALAPMFQTYVETGSIPPTSEPSTARYPFLSRNVAESDFSDAVSDTDCERLAEVFTRMHALSCKPIHTGFRVYSAIHYFSRSSGEPSVVFGTNTESSCFAQGVCAERSALMCLRTVDDVDQVTAVYVVSDAPVPLTPGMLCREFLTEFISPYTPIVIASLHTSPSHEAPPVGHSLHTARGLTFIARVVRLHWLYPHPPLLQSLWGPPGSEAASRAAHACRDLAGKWGFETDSAPRVMPHLADPGVDASSASASALPATGVYHPCADPADLAQLHGRMGPLPSLAAAARAAAASGDPEGGIAAISLAAAALMPDGSILTAAQAKVLEMGHSLDPLAALFARVRSLPHHTLPVLVVVSDSHGAMHPPSAAARALLCEHGWGRVRTAFFSCRAPVFSAAWRVPSARAGLYAAVRSPALEEDVVGAGVPLPAQEEARELVPRLPVEHALMVVCEMRATYPDGANFLACT